MRRGRAWKNDALALARWTIPAATALLIGCGGGVAVVRVVDGHVEAGRFIGPRAYEAFLDGALADEDGDLTAALAGYRAAAARDPGDPEVWTRIGWVRCRLKPGDVAASAAIDEALRLEPEYAPALDARRDCKVSRGQRPGAHDAGKLGVLIRNASPAPEAERRSIQAVTLLHGDRVRAWETLAAWGLAHGDVDLAVRGMVGVGRLSATRRWALGGWATALAGQSYIVAARQLAAGLLDADGDRSSGGEGAAVATLPIVARLALDEASRLAVAEQRQRTLDEIERLLGLFGFLA